MTATEDEYQEIRAAQASVPEEPIAPFGTSSDEESSAPVTQFAKNTNGLLKKSLASPILEIDFTSTGRSKVPIKNRTRRASTHQVDVAKAIHNLLGDSSATNLVRAECCGGGCCRIASGSNPNSVPSSPSLAPILLPNNPAFAALKLQLAPLTMKTKLRGTYTLPASTIAFDSLAEEFEYNSTVKAHPPKFVTPHPPYEVFPARIHHARCLTQPGAEKRTYHFDLDVTDYPEEGPGVDFVVGGAIGVCAPNDHDLVEQLFDILDIPAFKRDEVLTLHTANGRWPTIWGEEKERQLTTTRRELLTWTVDVQSYAPKKSLLRVLAEYATDEYEKKILMYLCSRQGQAAFCELRTTSHTSLLQLLHAFPSSKPPLEHLLGVLQPLMPRFYSLSSDPHTTRYAHRRIIEIAVTLHEADDWATGKRTGVGSGFFERMALKYIENKGDITIHIPMFRGLMQNPLAREFQPDGPMILIGAGVGIAPFRGFVQRRLQNANCANKVWVIQGIRDSLLDELYAGEWGADENKVKTIVESRVGTGRYVQEEVRNQADLVWFVINSLDGRIFVCGSSKGMGEGVEEALVDVAMKKGNLSRTESTKFWKNKEKSFQYITETW
ncbi:hypothetical protein H072_7917 [Dactylellina haptotyla CBS 200.50]|uniref:FAD-binding FR-type domain-containing protein n=1 Tax=Dactylellina haptotyla (strain CBS 200.50) TaxID=1284197 RepID=S8AB07_DACHA|nr:hypothetical protein H072_7917 [Dactylellina haptotyla CBS 200.50]